MVGAAPSTSVDGEFLGCSWLAIYYERKRDQVRRSIHRFHRKLLFHTFGYDVVDHTFLPRHHARVHSSRRGALSLSLSLSLLISKSDRH